MINMDGRKWFNEFIFNDLAGVCISIEQYYRLTIFKGPISISARLKIIVRNTANHIYWNSVYVLMKLFQINFMKLHSNQNPTQMPKRHKSELTFADKSIMFIETYETKPYAW